MQIRLSDVFGDNGMISVVIAHEDGDALDIDTWLMSCRVLGRGVEAKALDLLVEAARRRGKSLLTGSYIPTAKNMMVRDHYARLGFAAGDPGPAESMADGTTRWALRVADYVPQPSPIDLVAPHAAA